MTNKEVRKELEKLKDNLLDCEVNQAKAIPALLYATNTLREVEQQRQREYNVELSFPQIKDVLRAVGRYGDITQDTDCIWAFDLQQHEVVSIPMFKTLPEIIKFIVKESVETGYRNGRNRFR